MSEATTAVQKALTRFWMKSAKLDRLDARRYRALRDHIKHLSVKDGWIAIDGVPMFDLKAAADALLAEENS